MDILGYREMVAESEREGRQQEMLQSIHAALAAGRLILDGRYVGDDSLVKFGESEFFALKAFTDNVVLGFPIYEDGESEFGIAFSRLAYFQLSMVLKGYFVRGAVSVGDVYIDDIAVFGSALTDAYEGEQTLARDPRIILTSSAVERVKQHLTYYGNSAYAPQVRDLLCDADGQWFLNYLDEILIAEDEIGPDYESLLAHKEVVEAKLMEFAAKPTIFSKYAWVAGYHNAFCDMHSNHFGKAHRVDTELFRSRPKLIVEDSDQS
jgi:hypothetical protein